MMIATATTFQRESAMVIWEEALPMLRRHWAEMPHDTEMVFNPDASLYRRAEDSGSLRLYTMRVEETLVGYAAVMVFPSLWHTGKIEAAQHSLYVEPEHRGRRAYRFLQFIEQQLKAEGVRHVKQHVHPGRTEGRLFEKMGYTLAHLEYEKDL